MNPEISEQEEVGASKLEVFDALEALKNSNVILDENGKALIDALRVRERWKITYVRDPKEIPIELVDEVIDEDSSLEYRALVYSHLVEMMNAAISDQVPILAEVNRGCHLESKKDENIVELKEVFGEEVYRIARSLEWYADLCGNQIPSRLSSDFVENVHDLGREAARFLNMHLKDEAYAKQAKDAFTAVADKGVIRPEKWEEIKDLDPIDFVNNLFSYLGVHIGFQGFQHDELDRIKYPDLQRVKKFMLAGEKDKKKGRLKKLKKWFRKYSPSPKDRRSLDTMEPEVYITFDKGLFPELSGEDQLKALEVLNEALGDQELHVLGAVQIFDKAERTATMRDEDEARVFGSIPNRIALERQGTGEKVFFIINYDNPEDFDKRELQWNKVDAHNQSTRAGLAVGHVFPI